MDLIRTVQVFHEIANMLQEENADYNIMCGDFNLVLNPELDTNNYNLLNNPKTRDTVLKRLEDHDLYEIYSNLHRNKKMLYLEMEKSN